jgi:hypothetical protein
MATKSIQNVQQQLDAAQQRVKQLKAKQQALQARERAKEAKQRRADDTRRKILLGAYVMASAQQPQIQQMMDKYLTEDRDRALFGLEPKDQSQT